MSDTLTRELATHFPHLFPKPEYPAPGEAPKVTRVDFMQVKDGWLVIKYPQHWTASTAPWKSETNPPLRTPNGSIPFDIEKALHELEARGWMIRRWQGGARAWQGQLLPVRTGPSIKRLRQQYERWGPPAGVQLCQVDLAYDL